MCLFVCTCTCVYLCVDVFLGIRTRALWLSYSPSPYITLNTESGLNQGVTKVPRLGMTLLCDAGKPWTSMCILHVCVYIYIWAISPECLLLTRLTYLCS